MAAPTDASGPLREAGISHAPFDHPGDDALAPIWARLPGASPDGAMAIAAREIFAGVNARVALPKLQSTIATWRPDLIVRDSVEFAAIVAADRAGLPHARIAVHAVSFEEVLPPLVDGPIDTLRQQAGLPADAGASLRAEPTFTSFPASLDGPVEGSRMRAPFRSRPPQDQPSSAAAAWVPAEDRRPLVYITFGTIAGSTPHVRSVYRTALDAVADLPVRALLTTGRGLEPGALGAVPANVQVEAWVPQRDVLPHVAALLCHGGSGTVIGAFAAGLPLVVVRLFADQPHNARLIAAAGAGLTLSTPDAGALRAAIERVLGAPDFRRGARGSPTTLPACRPSTAPSIQWSEWPPAEGDLEP